MDLIEWKQTGKIFIWRYDGNPKNYRGWHMSADKLGCKSLLELLEIYKQYNTDVWRTLQLSTPTSEQYLVPSRRFIPIIESKLTIQKNENSEFWKIEKIRSKLMIETGTNNLAKLISGVNDVMNNKGDYFIGSKGQELWFW